MSPSFKALFEPIHIGTMVVKNRIGMAPMFTKYASESGEVTDKLIEYFVSRAEGGVGLIVVENACIDWSTGRGDGNPVAIHHDRFRPGLHELAKAVQRHGVKIVPEIHHAGRQTFSHNLDIDQPLAPSPVKSMVGGDMPRAMTEEEIEEAIQNYADAARRAKESGFDGVEVHAAHGYLISEFLSPKTNMRSDRWGGSLENRARFAVEVVRRIRREVGPDFPLLYRFSAEESTPHSLSLREGLEYAKLLETEGVDCFDVTHGDYESIKHFPMQGDPKDQLVYLAEAVKHAVAVPVIAVGSLGFDPDIAHKVVKDGKADLVHFGRELLADPDLPNKIRNNQLAEIRNCIRCNECTGSIDKGHFLTCAVNPRCGYEYKDLEKNGTTSKRIVVIGAGPAGLEFSVDAAARGHEVTLLEKNDHLGGLLKAASLPAYKKPEISALLNYYKVLLNKHQVDVQLGAVATVDRIADLHPDIVVLAVGSTPMELPFSGAHFSEIGIEKMMDGAEGIGTHVCIIGGSGVGIDMAMFMKEKGKEVTIIEMLGEVGGELSGHLKWHLKEKIETHEVKVLTSHRVIEITEEGVVADFKGKIVKIKCDSVLGAIGFKRLDTSTMEAGLHKRGIETLVLGSSNGAGHCMDAIHAGYWNALNV